MKISALQQLCRGERTLVTNENDEKPTLGDSLSAHRASSEGQTTNLNQCDSARDAYRNRAQCLATKKLH